MEATATAATYAAAFTASADAVLNALPPVAINITHARSHSKLQQNAVNTCLVMQRIRLAAATIATAAFRMSEQKSPSITGVHLPVGPWPLYIQFRIFFAVFHACLYEVSKLARDKLLGAITV